MIRSEVYSWELSLLSQALEAVNSAAAPKAQPLHQIRDGSVLDEAYTYCAFLTAAHSRSFHLASSLLPQAKRRAARALYAFCRVSDDIVDRRGQRN